MSDLSCPHCHRAGSVPKEKEHSRLVCKKCHGVFHVNALGKIQIGEPPTSKDISTPPRVQSADGDQPEESTSFWSLREVTRTQKRLFLAFGGVVVLAGCWMVFTEKPESLDVRANKAAKALTAENVTALQRFAKPGHEEYLREWLDSIKPRLEEMKTVSLTSTLKATVLVTEEDDDNGFGHVSFYLSPAGISARTREQDGSAGTGSRNATEYVAFWTREPSGRWMLDGQATLQRLVASR